jgi:hypothetical protein
MSGFEVNVRSMIKDYAAMPAGSVADGGEIQICSHCGRPGLSLQKNDLTVFYHCQWTELHGDRRKTQWDMCPNRNSQ